MYFDFSALRLLFWLVDGCGRRSLRYGLWLGAALPSGLVPDSETRVLRYAL